MFFLLFDDLGVPRTYWLASIRNKTPLLQLVDGGIAHGARVAAVLWTEPLLKAGAVEEVPAARQLHGVVEADGELL